MPFPLGPFQIESDFQISVSGAAAQHAVSTASISPKHLMITSPSTNPIIFILFATSQAAALAVATTNTPILPGTVQIFTIPDGTTNIGAITSSASGTLYCTNGEGQ